MTAWIHFLQCSFFSEKIWIGYCPHYPCWSLIDKWASKSIIIVRGGLDGFTVRCLRTLTALIFVLFVTVADNVDEILGLFCPAHNNARWHLDLWHINTWLFCFHATRENTKSTHQQQFHDCSLWSLMWMTFQVKPFFKVWRCSSLKKGFTWTVTHIGDNKLLFWSCCWCVDLKFFLVHTFFVRHPHLDFVDCMYFLLFFMRLPLAHCSLR